MGFGAVESFIRYAREERNIMKIRNVLSLVVLSGFAFGIFAAQAAESKLTVGDNAPKLQVAKWVQGQPVDGFEAGKTYIVEFWATWCGPCRASIPHLNELHEKFKDKGIIVIGQDVWEQDESTVAPFLKTMGEKMTYRVALDDKSSQKDGAMALTWMKAAGQNGIPTAFIINKQGRIAWIGHPMTLNEKLLDDVLSDNYDLTKAAAEFEQAQKARQEMIARAQTPADPEVIAADIAACKKNLEKIGAAIEAYRKDHNDVPNWLSDLVPKYLSDTNVLICPVCKRTGEKSPIGVLDTDVYTSYLYEFAPTPMPEGIKGAFPGKDMTMRDWKRQQMEVAGSKIPLVRCFLHLPVALNLSFGGEVYESPQIWEQMFYDKVKPEAFNPH
jgi:thiol-disulfide isomerase/thioredoxin